MKRPDQYRLDVDEAGATDYKQRPDTPNEAELSQEDAERALYDRMEEAERAKASPSTDGPDGEREGEGGPDDGDAAAD